jgi:hypothetical protein
LARAWTGQEYSAEERAHDDGLGVFVGVPPTVFSAHDLFVWVASHLLIDQHLLDALQQLLAFGSCHPRASTRHSASRSILASRS